MQKPSTRCKFDLEKARAEDLSLERLEANPHGPAFEPQKLKRACLRDVRVKVM